MPFDPQQIIDSFRNLDSLPGEAKDKLAALAAGLKFVAPELMVERLFCDFKSQQGLSSILNEHARESTEALNLYTEALAGVKEYEEKLN